MSEELEHNELIARWLSGDLTAEEKEQLKKKGQLGDLRVVLEDISSWSLPQYNVEGELNNIHSKLNDSSKTKVIALSTYWRYAAIIFLAVGAFVVFRYYQKDNLIQIATNIGEQTEHILPDGSIVKLDATSEIAYNQAEWKNHRTIEASGQVYFEVKKGTPFLVNTASGTVNVLGTKFTVRSINTALEVKCFEGKVQIKTANQQRILTQNMGLSSDGNTIETFDVEESEPTWFGTFSNYDNTRLITVIEDLKRYYEIEIDLPDKYAGYQYSGKVPHSNLEQAMKSIFVPLEINYSLQDGKVTFE